MIHEFGTAKHQYHKPKIGAGVKHAGTLLIDCQEQVEIGDFSFFGHDCKILTGMHDYFKKGKERQDAILSKPVVIGRGVWIASFSVILPGVKIGDNAVIGAGSIVTRDVPKNELWAGNPARKIKNI